MSLDYIRKALVNRLLTMDSVPFPTQQENDNQPSDPGQPYQMVNLMPGEPDNPTMGDDFYRELGYLQITLVYPLGTGPGLALARAVLIRSTFYRGLTLTSGPVRLQVDRTPEIAPAFRDADRYRLPVRIRYFANI